MFWSSAEARPGRRWPVCWPTRVTTWCCWKKPAIRAFTSVNRCCRPTCPCSNRWASPTRSRRSACTSPAPNSCPWNTDAPRPSISPMPGTNPCPLPTRCGAPILTRSCSATLATRARRPSRASKSPGSSSWTVAVPMCGRRTRTANPCAGARVSWSMPPAATPSWPTASRSSTAIRATTARRSTPTSMAPRAAKVSKKATSVSSGSPTAGSGSSR